MKFFGLVLCFLLILLSGCSVNELKTYQLKNTALSDIWPAGAEVPRYRYVGELHGVSPSDSVSGRTLFEKVIGLLQGSSKVAILERPYDVFVSTDDIVYVADLALQGVMVFNQKSKTVEVWKEIDHKTSFKAPVGIVGAKNEILVVDTQWAQVFRFSSTGKLLGSFGENNLKRPIGITYDNQSQRVYVSDAGLHTIQVFTLEGKFLTSIGRYGEALGEFNYPSAIEFSRGNLYISDTMNARIQIIDPNNLEKEVESFGYRGLNVGNTPRPKGVTVDSDGNIYAVESYYGYLLVYSEQGDFLLPISGKDREIGEFYLPSGVTTDSHNRIYLADTFNGRIVILQYLGN